MIVLKEFDILEIGKLKRSGACKLIYSKPYHHHVMIQEGQTWTWTSGIVPWFSSPFTVGSLSQGKAIH
jgi:hypothetical protein